MCSQQKGRLYLNLCVFQARSVLRKDLIKCLLICVLGDTWLISWYANMHVCKQVIMSQSLQAYSCQSFIWGLHYWKGHIASAKQGEIQREMNILKFNEKKIQGREWNCFFTKISLNLTIITVSLVLYLKPDHIERHMLSQQEDWIIWLTCCSTFLPCSTSGLKGTWCFFWIHTRPTLLNLWTTWITCSGMSYHASAASVYLAPVLTRLHSSNTVDKEKKAVQQGHKLLWTNLVSVMVNMPCVILKSIYKRIAPSWCMANYKHWSYINCNFVKLV